MQPNKPPHKRRKPSTLNQSEYHNIIRQNVQSRYPPFDNSSQQQQPLFQQPPLLEVQRQAQHQLQTTQAAPPLGWSSFTNLEPTSLTSQQANLSTLGNRFEDQEVFNYAHAPQALHSNIIRRQGQQPSHRGQYGYNQEYHGQPMAQSHRRVSSMGYDRLIEHPLASPPAPPLSATSSSFNFQHGVPYQGLTGQQLHHYLQREQPPQPRSQQYEYVRLASNHPHQNYYQESNIQHQFQQGSPRDPQTTTNPAVGGTFEFNPALAQSPPGHTQPTFDTNFSNPQQHQQQQQQAFYINPATGGNKIFSQPQSVFSTGSLQPSIQASSIASGPPSIPASVVTTAPTPAPVAVPQPSAPRHQKNTLSISSHLTSISLSGDKSEENVPISEHPGKIHRDSNSLLDDLLHDLFSVDGNNIGTYLHSLICKLNSPFPLDDFYNLLYNNDRQMLVNTANFHYNQKIDKTPISLHTHDLAASIMNQVLDVFRNPALLLEFFPNQQSDGPDRLSAINYHELLRTFLAIKILNDMMIEIHPNSSQDQMGTSIPRLSVFKTYFIICQKLITRYPSSSNTANEQQKLVLGQSKLGKLIKMVFPKLPIKRLGSRGESRYHYLGVVWNEHIIDDNIKQLCELHDLSKLNEMFIEGGGGNADYSELLFPGGVPVDTHPQIGPIPTGLTEGRRGRKRGRGGSKSKHRIPSTQSLEMAVIAPRTSFIKMGLMYPAEPNFTVVNESGQECWFANLLTETYSKSVVDPNQIKSMLLVNSNLGSEASLLNNLLQLVFSPIISQLNNTTTTTNLDLQLYTIIILEIMPVLLLIKPSADINLVTNLRLNLLYLIIHLPQELSKCNEGDNLQDVFSVENVFKFLNLVKRLINLNDLLITIVKLLNKQELNSMMANDILLFLDRPGASAPQQGANMYLTSLISGGGSSTGSSTAHGADFNFRNDILSNDLVHTMASFRYSPSTASISKSSVLVSSINEEASILDQFFGTDLLKFLTNEFDAENVQLASSSKEYKEVNTAQLGELEQTMSSGTAQTDTNVPSQPPPRASCTVLTINELAKLKSLLALIDTKLLSPHFKSKYPIQVYNNLITFILNDILKHIFLKQQQQQQREEESIEETSSSAQVAHRLGLNLNPNPNSRESSFGSWWVFNSIVQEYLSLLGEIVGLRDLI